MKTTKVDQGHPQLDTRSSLLLPLLARHPRTVILTCFFLSGATGLVYEVVWSRRLTLIFGATVLAVSTVLAVFLGGLAVGSLIFGRIADRRRDPFLMYALLEGGVGLACLVTPWLFIAVEQSYTYLHPYLAENVWLVRLLRFALSAIVLFVPTALMGGTLPVLSRAVVSTLPEVGAKVAWLYGINTLGAVVGAVSAGFLLIPSLGISFTIYTAALVNLGIAVIALALHVAQADHPITRPPEPAVPPLSPDARRAYQGLLLAYGASGAAALIYEVGWTRVLSLAFGTTTYAFSSMLGAFLLGIGLGSLVLASPRVIRLDRLRAPLLWFGVLEVAIAACVTFLTPLLDRLPLTFLTLFRYTGPRFWALQAAEAAVSAAVMLLPAALMGLAFPLVTHIATENLGAVGRRLAAVYAANTAGTVVGSFASGFILIPLLGVRTALAMGVMLNLAVGLAYLGPFVWRERSRLATVGVAAAALVIVSWPFLPDWNKAVLTSGAYIYPGFYLQGDARAIMQDKQILHYRDALTGTISVTSVSLPGLSDEPVISLQINGKTDASTRDLSTQLMFAHLPALLHPAPRKALIIGLASGCTLGALELHPQIQQIDCVEIEPEMKRVTDFFRHVNHDCLKDPRVRLVYDARNFIRVTKECYDIITSEPSNPWIAGVANLFTKEYFVHCREHLTANGLFCQWFPIYNLAPWDLQCIVGTFRDVFPHCSLWLFPDLLSDAYLVGTLSPQRVDLGRVASGWNNPLVAADLKAAQLRDPWDFASGYLMGEDKLAALSQAARRNTDDLPVLEFTSPLVLHTGIARVTMIEVLRMASRSQPPLVGCGRAFGQSYRSQLLGLTIGPAFSSLLDEYLSVRRDIDTYTQGDSEQWLQATGYLRANLEAGEARVYAWRSELPSGEEVPAVPDRAPDRTLAVSSHQTGLWNIIDGSGRPGWFVRWNCPVRKRCYLIAATAAEDGRLTPAATALAGTHCDH